MNMSFPMQLALLAQLATLVSAFICYRIGLREGAARVAPTLDQLAARADANGMELMRLAREAERACDTDEPVPHVRLRRWARTLRQASGEHLECINAISLQALRDAGADRAAALHDDATATAVASREAALRRVSHV